MNKSELIALSTDSAANCIYNVRKIMEQTASLKRRQGLYTISGLNTQEKKGVALADVSNAKEVFEGEGFVVNTLEKPDAITIGVSW